MWRLPRTIKAALLGGFFAIFTVWLTSACYLTDRLTESEASSAAIHTRFARGQELLFTIRTQVLLGSIYVRDALIDPSERSAGTAHGQLRSLEAQVKQELEQYASTVDSAVDQADWKALEDELRDYWERVTRLAASGPENPIGTAQALLRTQVIPKRDAIIQMSEDIRQLMADAVTRERQELARVHELARRRMWETTAVAVFFGIGVAMVAIWYVGRLEATIHEDHAAVVRNKQELQRLSGKLVSAQEAERRTIARELHDEIGQALTAVQVELAVVGRSVGTNGQAAAALDGARLVTERALGEVRDLSQLLRPTMLDDFGLPETLKWYLRKFSDRTGVRTELIEDGLAERLSIDVEVCAYRTIQEALTNVSRHAHAGACRVFVQRLPSSLIVTVEDDGKGLQRDSMRRGGLGLVGIRERAADLGGTFRIESESRQGTRLTIELPLTNLASA